MNIGNINQNDIPARQSELSKRLLDGTVRDPDEIMRIVKQMGKENGGTAYFKTTGERIGALMQIMVELSPESEVKATLNEVGNDFLLEDFQMGRFMDKRLNPTILNGGLNWNGKENIWDDWKEDKL